MLHIFGIFLMHAICKNAIFQFMPKYAEKLGMRNLPMRSVLWAHDLQKPVNNITHAARQTDAPVSINLPNAVVSMALRKLSFSVSMRPFRLWGTSVTNVCHHNFHMTSAAIAYCFRPLRLEFVETAVNIVPKVEGPVAVPKTKQPQLGFSVSNWGKQQMEMCDCTKRYENIN